MKIIFLFFACLLIIANPVYAQNLSKSDLKTAQELSAAYATQLFVANCYQEHKDLLKIDPKTNRAKMTIENLNRSCACMAGNIIKEYSATDLIDYITVTRGQVPIGGEVDSKTLGFEKDNVNEINPETTNLSKIAIMNGNPTEYKKCGLYSRSK